MGEQIIFRYELMDSWGDTIAKLEVTDAKRDNVRCLYPCVSPFVKGEEPTAKIITLDDDKIHKIIDILMEHAEIFEIKEVEFPMILDGYMYHFDFSAAGRTTHINAFNIYAYRNMESINAKIVIEIFDAIAEILLAEGVDQKYLAFTLD